MRIYSKNNQSLPSLSLIRHDGDNVELKVHYPVDKTRKYNKYLLELYLFFPSTLQINSNTYSADSFFLDLNNYMRFKTPQLTIPEILDKGNSISPITKIGSLTKNKMTLSSDDQEKIVYELKLLGSIVKAYLRDCKDHYDKKEPTRSDIISFVIELENLGERKLALEREINRFALSQQLEESIFFVNCYISYLSQTAFMYLLKSKNAEDFEDRISSNIKKEIKFREDSLSPLVIKRGETNEQFSHWKAIHKKFVQSVLYLEKDTKDKKKSAILLFHSFAAGSAMFVSILLGFYASSNFKQNSPIFIFVLVFAYIFKDRLKEFLKISSVKITSTLFPDRYYSLIDGFKGRKIGSFVEDFEHLQSKDTPFEVIEVRNKGKLFGVEKSGEFEDRIYYRKFIKVNNKLISKIHTRHNDISGVTRINLKKFMRYMDDSVQKELFVNEDGGVEDIVVLRTYHINAVVRVRETQSGETSGFQKFRIIVDKEGVQKVEED